MAFASKTALCREQCELCSTIAAPSVTGAWGQLPAPAGPRQEGALVVLQRNLREALEVVSVGEEDLRYTGANSHASFVWREALIGLSGRPPASRLLRLDQAIRTSGSAEKLAGGQKVWRSLREPHSAESDASSGRH